LLQVLSGDHVARVFQQNGEHLERLPAKPQFFAILAQLARLHVRFKRTEPDKPGTGLSFSHWEGSSRFEARLIRRAYLTPYLFNFNNPQQLCWSTLFPYFIDMDS